MKPGGSSLNPYAAAYIPLSKRELDPEHYLKAFPEGDSEGTSKQRSQDVFSTKSHYSTHACYGGPSQNVNEAAEEQTIDEQFEMALDYLKMEFSGLSEESLSDAYLVNKGDLEATVEMLNQLEFSESLPDTLDIGDVSESGSSAHCASLKQKHVPGAAEGSSESPGSSQVVS